MLVNLVTILVTMWCTVFCSLKIPTCRKRLKPQAGKVCCSLSPVLMESSFGRHMKSNPADIM